MFEEDVSSQMEAIISLASIYVILFPPNYVEWKSFLDALIHMIKSEVTILHVFHIVKPSKVRWMEKDKDGPYA